MPVVKYDKLIRDKLPELIKEDLTGEDVIGHIAHDDVEFVMYLNKKVKEELKELMIEHEYWYKEKEFTDQYDDQTDLQNATQSLLSELADLIEVVEAFFLIPPFNKQEVERIRKEKFEAYGGFERRFILEEVVEGED